MSIVPPKERQSVLNKKLQADYLFDSHCHLQFPEFNKDLDTVINEAITSGLQKIMVPATNLENAHKAIAIAEKYPNLIEVAVGNHPYNADQTTDSCIEAFCNLIENHNCVTAIGETGLDTYNCNIKLDTQLEALTKHVKLCKNYQLPIIIHTRETDELTPLVLSLLDQYTVPNAVFHCFSGSLAIAQAIWSRGYHTSFSCNITYPSNTELLEIAKQCPPELLLIETDSPYLSPQGQRSERNEPINCLKVWELRN